MIAEKSVDRGVVRRVTREAGRDKGHGASYVSKDANFVAIVDVLAEMVMEMT
jgi:hypothetical protein